MFKLTSMIAVSLFSLPVLATNPVIYGEDNRQEVYEANPFHQKLAASAITMIAKDKMSRSPEKPGFVQLEQITLRSWLESQFEEEKSRKLSKSAQEAVDQKVSFCATERFTEQPNPGMCSGFLVAPDLIVTAGHCVAIENMCETFDWVFDFRVDSVTKTAGVDVKEENVYSCKKVISAVLANGLGLDYALIQLDRKVKDREPLELRTSGKVESNANLVVIGNPSGLPLKVASGATVRNTSHPFYFSANLDTFQGNSGSAVINEVTGKVEGILVRGEEDFEANMGLMCIEAKRCDDSGCRGEDVSRMTSIPEYAVKDALFRIAEKGDVKELENLTRTSFWVDINGKDGMTALMVASEWNRTEFVKALIAKGSDVNLSDARGRNALHKMAPRLTRKDTELVKVLVDAGIDLEAKNDHGESALMTAARTLNLEGVKLLISLGADKNTLNRKNETVLFPFARRGDQRALKELISLGVDASLRNTDGLSVDDLAKGKKI